jgi:hypothetical protein
LDVEEHEAEHEKESVDLDLDPFFDKQGVDCFMNVEECPESEFANQLVEEKVVVPIFLVDDIAWVYGFPIYDDDMMLNFKRNQLYVCHQKCSISTV